MKFLIISLALLAAVHAQERKAIAKMVGPTVNGNITFTQLGAGPVKIQGSVIGLTPGKYGFHVHEKGDITGGCLSAGGHFNPHGVHHGGPKDPIRHVGDLGNIEVKDTNTFDIDMEDSVISLFGDHNIIGRTMMIHSGEDDLGRGNHPDSKTTGNAGSRVSCGVIGILIQPPEDDKSKNAGASMTSSYIIAISFLLAILRLL